MPKNIDDRFVDVDFSKEEPFVFGAKAPDLHGFGNYEDEVGIMSDSQIMEEIERIEDEDSGTEHLITRIFDQKQEGSCVANACAQAHQIIQAKELGKDMVVQLSAMSLYKRIGNSPQSGAIVSDGLREMERAGLLPLDNAENRERFDAVMPNTGFSTPYPDNWKQTAKLFASLEWVRVQTVEGYYTALSNRHPIIVGREGHSVCHVTPIIHKGKRASQYANSWRESWGFADAGFSGGFGVDTERQVEKSVRNGCFALRSLVWRPPA